MGAETGKRTRKLPFRIKSLVRREILAIGSGRGEQVAAFVLRVARVAFDPFPVHGVFAGEGVKAKPEILVLHGLFL